ncbi:MAG: homoserine kinase [Sporichthyaceae bacterium]|nr:homoserine kinase [Sporichthyaceae bacterium]
MIEGFAAGPVRVRVPATSANLGPGFDAFGLALGCYDEVTARVTGSGLRIEVRGEGAGTVSLDEGHLVVRAMRYAFDRIGSRPPGLEIECTNRIPHGRGLGSSAAAIVSGVILARSLSLPSDPDTPGGELRGTETDLTRAAELEGHPDNVAACLFGGLTVAWSEPGGAARAIRLEPSPKIAPIVLVPVGQLATEQARRLLPDTVPHSDAAHSATRAALLTQALTDRPDLLLIATEDRLHQVYRAPAMPASHELLGALRAAGVAAVISGAGPAVLALTQHDQHELIRGMVTEGGWSIYEFGIDSDGVRGVRLRGTQD